MRRIVEEPPLITRLPDREAELLAEALDEYLLTLAPHWRRVLGGYTLRRRRAQGGRAWAASGCAPTSRCWRAPAPDDVVFLQLKQARRSVLARYVHGESAWHAHQGQRVVEYQQALQTVSDPLLGWTTVDGRQYYVRQFRNMKGTIPLDAIDAAALTDYAGRGRPAAGQGPRPDQRGVDDRRLRRAARTGWTRRCAGSPGATPTRPRPTTPRWSPPSTAGSCRSSAASDRGAPCGVGRRGSCSGAWVRCGRR